MDEGFGAQAERYAALEDPTRRGIYRFVRGQHRPVTREEVAVAVGVSRSLAAFHLERLLDSGLLSADYARREGRGGPGAGRPAKRYTASSVEISIEIPPRRYVMAGRLLAQAIEGSGADSSPREEALRLATDEGRRLGCERAVGRSRYRRPADEAASVLAELGFEPVVDPSGRIALSNCPFHALADAATELVCGMNEALLGGLLEGLGSSDLRAVLAPAEGRCCVVLRRHEPGGDAA